MAARAPPLTFLSPADLAEAPESQRSFGGPSRIGSRLVKEREPTPTETPAPVSSRNRALARSRSLARHAMQMGTATRTVIRSLLRALVSSHPHRLGAYRVYLSLLTSELCGEQCLESLVDGKNPADW